MDVLIRCNHTSAKDKSQMTFSKGENMFHNSQQKLLQTKGGKPLSAVLYKVETHLTVENVNSEI